MPEVLLTIDSDPAFPAAGKPFRIIARLATPASEDLLITFEKHRVTVDASGTHVLCPILPGYFADGGLPGSIDVKKGDTGGSSYVTVSNKAANPPCPPPDGNDSSVPVLFPDRLMLTAFVSKPKPPFQTIGKAHLVITITAP
jgi:hypothetical protein